MALSDEFVQDLSGNLVLAAFFNAALLGILFIQIYAYYMAFPRDRVATKILVYIVFTLEVLQTGLTFHDIFIALGNSVGAADPLNVVDLIYHHWFSIPVSGGITGVIGQLFFAYRIWRISQNSFESGQISSTSKARGAPLVISALAVGSLISALICASTFFRARTFSVLLGQQTNNGASESMASIGVWNGIGAICDIVIALSMPYYLMRHGTGLPNTHIMVVKLVRLIIETGAFTAIIAITHLCLYFGGTTAFIVPGLALSKVYANTMIAILNNRMEIVDGRKAADETPMSPGVLSSITSSSKSNRPRPRATIIVTNERLTFRMDDLPRRTNPGTRKSGEEAALREGEHVIKYANQDPETPSFPKFPVSETELCHMPQGLQPKL